MKKSILGVIALAAASLTASLAAQKPSQYSGEIMDSMCAAMGSHTQMMKDDHRKDAKDCTLGCVRSGATFVFVESETRMVYKLDNQKKPRSFAGQLVTLTGTIDSSIMTIHVKGVDPAPTGRRPSDW